MVSPLALKCLADMFRYIKKDMVGVSITLNRLCADYHQFSVATTFTAAVASLAVRCKNLTIASGNHGSPWVLS